MANPQHPSQLPDGWKDQINWAYDVFAFGDMTQQRAAHHKLRDKSGQYMRRRNSIESMKNAPSPYKTTTFYPSPLHELIRPDRKGLPKDIYSTLQNYLDPRPGAAKWNRETMTTINNAHGKPDAAVTVFRPVPWIINQLMPGDAVLLSPSYAGTLAANRPKWRVITGTVPAKELFTRSDDQLMRWNWNGRNPIPNGGVVVIRPARGRRYQAVKNPGPSRA